MILLRKCLHVLIVALFVPYAAFAQECGWTVHQITSGRSTKDLPAPGTYRIRISLDDRSTYTVDCSLQ